MFSHPTSISLFEFSDNCRIKYKISSKLTIEATDTVLVSLLLTLNIFETFLVFFVEFEHVNARWNTLLP